MRSSRRDLERVLQAVDARLGKKPTVGVFHSMSGRAAMKHAIEIGWRWDALMLFDPPNVPPPSHPKYELMRVFENRLTEWALGRRRRFASVDELASEYLASRATKGWVRGRARIDGALGAAQGRRRLCTGLRARERGRRSMPRR